MLILLALLMLMMLSGFTIKSNLTSLLKALQKVESSKRQLEEASCSSFTEEAGQDMMHMWCSGKVPQAGQPSTSAQQAVTPLDEAIREAEQKKWKAAELFKVNRIATCVWMCCRNSLCFRLP